MKNPFERLFKKDTIVHPPRESYEEMMDKIDIKIARNFLEGQGVDSDLWPEFCIKAHYFIMTH